VPILGSPVLTIVVAGRKAGKKRPKRLLYAPWLAALVVEFHRASIQDGGEGRDTAVKEGYDPGGSS